MSPMPMPYACVIDHNISPDGLINPIPKMLGAFVILGKAIVSKALMQLLESGLGNERARA